METIRSPHPINLKVVKFEVDFSKLVQEPTVPKKKKREIKVPKLLRIERRPSIIPPPPELRIKRPNKSVNDLVEELLDDLYSNHRDWSSSAGTDYRGSISAASIESSVNDGDRESSTDCLYLEDMEVSMIKKHLSKMQAQVVSFGDRLGRHVRARDRLRRQQRKLCAAFSVLLRHLTGDQNARFGLAPGGAGAAAGDGSFAEWLHAMRLVARLPAGVPPHFRKKLWLSLSERHLSARGVDWPAAERACFRGTAQPDDTELGAQILKDLHRTGCSLFCGAEGKENQAMLRRVLLAYARWNKDVGYCQGFNMLAAIILEVMDKSESDALKVMIYLVEAVLPEGYFADDLRGLSADMAAFRDLLKLRLPRLANHMDHLQKISDGGGDGVEPPLPDVFTMQWFLTLYATWLPRDALLRIWDLVLLDGNEVLLLTALAIWDLLQDRIMCARSADEYYSCMGGGAGAVWAASEALVGKVVALGPAPELPRLRHAHRYRVSPPQPHAPLHTAVQSMTKRGLRLFYSEDEGESSDDGNKMALATVMIPRREENTLAGERLSLDIGALKRQYARLRERQRQAHVILAAACARHAAVGIPTSPTSLSVNNLLLGKSALVSNRGRRLGPPPGAIPPSRSTSKITRNETISWNEEKSKKTLSRRNSLKWKDIKKQKSYERLRKPSIDLDEAGDGILLSEHEANEMIASIRSRSSSETSSYSSRSESSSDTSLCDNNAKDSDSEPEISLDKNESKEKTLISIEDKLSPLNNASRIDSKISSINNNDKLHEHSTLNISQYIKTPAGEPLRNYIGGFETKLQESVIAPSDSRNVYRFLDLKDKSLSPPANKITEYHHIDVDKIELIQRINVPSSQSNIKVRSHPRSPINITDLSPIEMSPCNVNLLSPLDLDLHKDQLKSSKEVPSEPNSCNRDNTLVPDTELCDKNVSDLDSPPRSPGADSIIVSEDEPPIPLKIDKYFEHSPEFFGARFTITDSNNPDVSRRRPQKRNFRPPKKPDSLTLQFNNSDKLQMEDEGERSSSLPQCFLFSSRTRTSPKSPSLNNTNKVDCKKEPIGEPNKVEYENASPTIELKKETCKINSERALQIIQENSKILSRILTKHHKSSKNESSEANENKSPQKHTFPKDNIANHKETIDESVTSLSKSLEMPNYSNFDSLVRYRKKLENTELTDFLRARPVSIDDPITLEKSISLINKVKLSTDNKSPSTECLVNKTDMYGWENKGFLAKCDYSSLISKPDDTLPSNKLITPDCSTPKYTRNNETKNSAWDNRTSSVDGKSPSCETPRDFRPSPFDRKLEYENFSYSLSSTQKDLALCKEISNRIGNRDCENISKTDGSQMTDFANIITSSISVTCEESAEDDSPFGAKSNSSDTLCQITSLDQVSTPISPKTFPKDTATFLKEFTERSERNRLESDDTCSTITSLVETETLSSLSYPRSPSSGSYHHFPTRPSLRLPKEIGVRLGMYNKDSVSSPQK